MKVAVLSESPADEAAARILLEAILQRKVELLRPSFRRAGGWAATLGVLPAGLKWMHYQTDADAIVAVIDSNNSPIHAAAHEQPGQSDSQCRLCRLREAVESTRRSLSPVAGRAPVKVALGLAVPAIEAWLRCGIDPNVSEAAWSRLLESGQASYGRKLALKQDTYGTDRPALTLETTRATEEASRLAGNLDLLEKKFPGGFGHFARQVRGWK